MDDEVSPDITDEGVNGAEVQGESRTTEKSRELLLGNGQINSDFSSDEKRSLREWACSHKYDAKLLFHKVCFYIFIL